MMRLLLFEYVDDMTKSKGGVEERKEREKEVR